MLGLLTVQRREECLSQTFIHSIATLAGYTVEYRSGGNDFAVDGTIRPLRRYEGHLIESGRPLDFQLKATINWEIDQDSVIYDMEAAAYNKLVFQNSNPEDPLTKVLVLLCLPRSEKDWMLAGEEALIMKRCCYWEKIVGPATPNSASVRVRISRSQILTPDALSNMMNRCQSGEL